MNSKSHKRSNSSPVDVKRLTEWRFFNVLLSGASSLDIFLLKNLKEEQKQLLKQKTIHGMKKKFVLFTDQEDDKGFSSDVSERTPDSCAFLRASSDRMLGL